MSKYYDLIASVDIDLTTPHVEDNSFDKLLIVGALPKTSPAVAPAKVGYYASLNEVASAGWVTSGDKADPVGVAAAVAFAQDPVPDGIYIAPIQADETAVDAITRAVATPGWYGVCTAGVDASQYESIAEYVESQNKMFGYTELDCFGDDAASDTCTPTVSGEYFRTFGIYARESADQADENVPENNKHMAVAFMVKWLSYQSGSETAAYKHLEGMRPADLSEAQIAAMTAKNLSYFVSVGGRNVTLNGKVVAGEWMDIIRFRDWQKNDMQSRVFRLFVENSKVPYTDAGIALVQNQMYASLKAGQDAGGIAQDEYDANGKLVAAYTASVPSSASISATEKASRRLNKCTFTARLAGAIHFAEIHGSLTYKM